MKLFKKTLNIFSFFLIFNSLNSQAIEDYELSIKNAKNKPKIKILNYLSFKLEDSDIEKALNYSEEAYNLSKKNDDNSLLLASSQQLAHVYQCKTDYLQSIKYYLESFEL